MTLLLLLAACGPATVTFDSGWSSPDDSDVPVVLDEDIRLYVNEFMASNGSTALEPDGDVPIDEDWTPDWIELYNPSGVPLDLSGFSITDDLSEPALHVLEGVALPARGYLLLYADGQPELGPRHLPFKLSAGGESLTLRYYGDSGHRVVDEVRFWNEQYLLEGF